MVRKLNENANSLKDQIYAFLDDEGMYTDYNQKIEDVMDNFSLSREDAESFVWSHASGVEGTGLYDEENYLYNESTIKENDYSETDEFTLIKEMNHWIKDLKKFFVDDSNAQKAIADYFYYDDGAHQEDFKELQASVKTLHKLYNKLDNIVEDVEEKEYTKKNKKESLSLKEQDVEIEVKHEGILEVPEGKNVDELPIKHFVALANKKGLSKITKALNNLQVWNKNKDPKLSKWAGDMIDKVTKRVENQTESFIREKYIRDNNTLLTAEDLGIENDLIIPNSDYPYVLTDCGCYDLTKQNINPIYTCVSRQHRGFRNLTSKQLRDLRNFTYDVVVPAFARYCNVSEDDVTVDDFTSALDAFRIWITNTK